MQGRKGSGPHALRSGLGARAPLTRAEATGHRAIWHHLLVSAAPPDAVKLARTLRVTPAWAGALLRRLEAKDYVVLAQPGAVVTAAYPLSAVPTRHRVALGDGRTVYALCAVDALGVSQLTGKRARVASSCPACGGPIGVTVEPDRLVRAVPASARVWRGAAGRSGPRARRH